MSSSASQKLGAVCDKSEKARVSLVKPLGRKRRPRKKRLDSKTPRVGGKAVPVSQSKAKDVEIEANEGSLPDTEQVNPPHGLGDDKEMERSDQSLAGGEGENA